MRKARYLLFLAVLLAGEGALLAQGGEARSQQETQGWSVEAPAETLQLVQVAPSTLDGRTVGFELKNISKKAIVAFSVFAPRSPKPEDSDGAISGVSSFSTGEGLLPGKSFQIAFGKESLEEVPGKRLVVETVVFEDGSDAGSPEKLKRAEAEMAAEALETRRILNLLAASPDGDASRLAELAARPELELPEDDERARARIDPVQLPGLPPVKIQGCLQKGAAFAAARRGVQEFKIEAAELQRRASQPLQGSAARQIQEQEARQHVISVMGKEYRERSERQIRTIRGFRCMAEQ